MNKTDLDNYNAKLNENLTKWSATVTKEWELAQGKAYLDKLGENLTKAGYFAFGGVEEAQRDGRGEWELAYEKAFLKCAECPKLKLWGNGKTAESITGADIILEWNGVDGHPRVIYLQIKALFKGFNAYLKYAKKGATTDETTRWGGNNSTSPYFNALYKSSVNGNFQVTALEDAVWKGESQIIGAKPTQEAGFLLFDIDNQKATVISLRVFERILAEKTRREGNFAYLTEEVMEKLNRDTLDQILNYREDVGNVVNWVSE